MKRRPKQLALDLPQDDPYPRTITCPLPDLARAIERAKEQGLCVVSATVKGATYVLEVSGSGMPTKQHAKLTVLM